MREIINYWAESRGRVLVAGVGGAGTNAVNCMVDEGMEGVRFVCVDTDKKNLRECRATAYMQIGERMTGGYGAGERPEIGEKAAEESRAGIEDMMEGFDMVFVICGMGGGTGTGAAPVIARIAKTMGMLAVAIVTKPFYFEGEKRIAKALDGIEKLKGQVDTMSVILNDKLLGERGRDAFKSGMFCMADVVFRQMVQRITELFIRPALINLDFSDIVTVMKGKGIAYVGSGTGMGESKYQDAIREALTNPLMETSIEGASHIILHIIGEITLLETNEVCYDVQEKAGDGATIILGTRLDQECPDTVNITVIATGMGK